MITVEHALALEHRINTVPFQGIPLGGTLNHLIMTRYLLRRPLGQVICPRMSETFGRTERVGALIRLAVKPALGTLALIVAAVAAA